MLNTVIF